MAVNLDEYYSQRKGKQYQHANVHFERREEINPTKSEQKGIPVYEERDVCVVVFPGRGPEYVDVTDKHKQEYAEQWLAFQKGLEPPIEGFPLSEWPMMDRNTVEELRKHGFKTVENLATCTDDIKRKIGPLSQWCKKAKKFLEAAGSGQNEIVRLQELNERNESKIKKLEDQVMLLIRRIEAETGTRILDAA